MSIKIAIESSKQISKREAIVQTGSFFLIRRRVGFRFVFFMGYHHIKKLWHCIKIPGTSKDLDILARLSAVFQFIKKNTPSKNKGSYVVAKTFKRNAMQVYRSKRLAIKRNFKNFYRTYKDTDVLSVYQIYFKPPFISRFIEEENEEAVEE